MRARAARRYVAVALAVVGVYGALAVWLTWPLAPHAATHLPDTWRGCRSDPLHIAWALAHQTRALTTEPWRFAEANAYYPTRHALFYVDAGFAALPLFAPPFLLTGNPTLAINFTFLAGVVLTAAALHLVVRYWTGSHLAGLIAAWTFLTTRWVLWTWVPVAPNYAVLFCLPPIVMLAARNARARVLAPLVALQGLATPYLAAATLAPLGALACARIVRRSARTPARRLVAALALAGLVLVAGYSGYIVVHHADLDVARRTVWADSARTPMPLPQGLAAADAATAVPGCVLVLIAAGAASAAWARRRRESVPARDAWIHGGLWVVVGVVASLTPVVLWFGTPVTLPERFVADWLPVYDIIRFPDRLAVAALVGLAILGGVAFAECARRLEIRGRSGRVATTALAALLTLAMYREYAGGSRPLPPSYPLWTPPTVGSAIDVLLRQPGGPLLELPVGQVTGPDSANDAPLQARAMFRSIFHRRPIVNGYGGYWPDGFPERMALARRLPDTDALAALRASTGVEMILVHPRLYGAVEREVCRMLERRHIVASRCDEDFGAAKRAGWRGLAARGGDADLRLVAADGDDLLFAVRPASE